MLNLKSRSAIRQQMQILKLKKTQRLILTDTQSECYLRAKTVRTDQQTKEAKVRNQRSSLYLQFRAMIKVARVNRWIRPTENKLTSKLSLVTMKSIINQTPTAKKV